SADFRSRVAKTRTAVAHALRAIGDEAGAEAESARAVEALRGLVADFPETQEHRFHLANALLAAAEAPAAPGPQAEADRGRREALAVLDAMAEGWKARDDFQDLFSQVLADLARSALTRGRADEAVGLYRRAAVASRAAVQANPQSAINR